MRSTFMQVRTILVALFLLSFVSGFGTQIYNEVRAQAETTATLNPEISFPQENKNPPRKADVQSFTFELQECKTAGSSVICEFLITNSGGDIELSLYAGRFRNALTRIFDEGGNEYLAGQVRLGNKSSREDVRMLIVSDTPTKASITFDKVSPETSLIKLLEIRGFSNEPLKVQFRNLAINK